MKQSSIANLQQQLDAIEEEMTSLFLERKNLMEEYRMVLQEIAEAHATGTTVGTVTTDLDLILS